MGDSHSLVLDVGTTGIKAFVFDRRLNVIAKTYLRLNKRSPKKGWVEQNPRELVSKSKNTLERVVKESKAPLISFSGLGITNQRETVILWDRQTGKPVYPAIVWEDKRTTKYCQAVTKKHGRAIQLKTGLKVTPYFSATKIAWILKNVPNAKKLLAKNRLLFGTADSWIIWNLTQERFHLTDYTNAARTLLFNIKRLHWDQKLLDTFEIPAQVLPVVRSSRATYGFLHPTVVGAPLPITSVCGDQQASMFAAGIGAGTTKVTYGTGTFVMQSLGMKFRLSKFYLTTLIPGTTKPLYAAEAKIECCGNKIDSLLSQSKSLTPTLRTLAGKVNTLLKSMPNQPRELIIDGGVAQAPELARMQSAVSRVPVRQQKIFDGTALGVAKLMHS